MDKRVEEFLEKKKNEAAAKEFEAKKAEKEKILISLGLYDKVYSPDNKYSEEYPYYDGNTNKNFKKIPYTASDEEFEEVKKYANNQNHENTVAKILTYIAYFIFGAGFILGIIFASLSENDYYSTTSSAVFVLMTYWSISFISAMLFLGFAEIIKILEVIKNK